MKTSEIHGEFNKWIAGLLGVTTIKAHQGGKDPELPYIMTNLVTDRAVQTWDQDMEWFDTGEDNGGGETKIKLTPVVEKEWHLSTHAYGPEPMDILRPLESAHKVSQIIEPLLPQGLTLHKISSIRNVPDWINNKWQPRAQIDVYIRGLTRDGFIVDVIEVATVTHTREN